LCRQAIEKAKPSEGRPQKNCIRAFRFFIAEYFASVCVANKYMTLYPNTNSCWFTQTNAAGAGKTTVILPEEDAVVAFLATQSLAHGVGSSMKKKTTTSRLQTTTCSVITTSFSTVDKLFQAQKKSGQIDQHGVNDSGRFQHANMKLTTEQVVHIYEHKRESRGMAARLASEYGVRPKTIRDIWTHRTHGRVTSAIGCIP